MAIWRKASDPGDPTRLRGRVVVQRKREIGDRKAGEREPFNRIHPDGKSPSPSTPHLKATQLSLLYHLRNKSFWEEQRGKAEGQGE